MIKWTGLGNGFCSKWVYLVRVRMVWVKYEYEDKHKNVFHSDLFFFIKWFRWFF